jgi:hypothetical protein
VTTFEGQSWNAKHFTELWHFPLQSSLIKSKFSCRSKGDLDWDCYRQRRQFDCYKDAGDDDCDGNCGSWSRLKKEEEEEESVKECKKTLELTCFVLSDLGASDTNRITGSTATISPTDNVCFGRSLSLSLSLLCITRHPSTVPKERVLSLPLSTVSFGYLRQGRVWCDWRPIDKFICIHSKWPFNKDGCGAYDSNRCTSTVAQQRNKPSNVRSEKWRHVRIERQMLRERVRRNEKGLQAV